MGLRGSSKRQHHRSVTPSRGSLRRKLCLRPKVYQLRTIKVYGLRTLKPKSTPVINGFLHVIFGPMFSGKSLYMISKLSTLADRGVSVLYVNHSDDIRTSMVAFSDTSVTTHSHSCKGLSPKVNSVKTSDLSLLDISKYDVIGVDESQFFDKLKEPVLHWVNVDKKHVLCCGLMEYTNGDKFGELLDLIPKADKVDKKSSDCEECRRLGITSNVVDVENASFTGLRNGPPTGQKLVGGHDQYMALCRYHYAENLLK